MQDSVGAAADLVGMLMPRSEAIVDQPSSVSTCEALGLNYCQRGVGGEYMKL